MAKVTYYLEAEEICKTCKGKGEITHPAFKFWYQDHQSGKDLASYLEALGCPRNGNSEMIVCPACDGKGYFVRRVKLEDALEALREKNNGS